MWALERHEERTVVTDADGYYRFEDVLPGEHVIQVQSPAGRWPTTNTSVEITTALHQTLSVSFGFYRPPALSFVPLIMAGW